MRDVGAFRNTGSTSTIGVLLDNENYCHVTSETKSPIFSVAEDVISFSQSCMKRYGNVMKRCGKRTWLTRKFSLIIASLQRDVSLKIWFINISRIFANRVNLTPVKGSVNVMVTLALNNLLRFKPSDSYTPKGSID